MDSYLIYGPPGSGKTRASQEVCESLGIDYISVGNVTRREISSGSEIGKQLKYYLDIPLEYPLGLIAGVIEAEVSELVEKGRKFMLDGFPKYSWEAEHFVKYISQNKIVISAVIIIDLDLKIALERVETRYICDHCQLQQEVKDTNMMSCKSCSGNLVKREDDSVGVVSRRYSDYEISINETLAKLDGHYQRLVRINGDQTVEAVINELKQNLET